MFTLKVVDRPLVRGKYYYQGDFNKLAPVKDFDCVITPGNTFGIMDGGFDKVVMSRFPKSQERVQDAIRLSHGLELTKGSALVVELEVNLRLVYVPTMRFPGTVTDKDTVYNAALAAFCAIMKYNQKNDNVIKNVVMPLFGTATGGVPAINSYKQIEYAHEIATTKLRPRSTWDITTREHRDKLSALTRYTNERTGR